MFGEKQTIFTGNTRSDLEKSDLCAQVCSAMFEKAVSKAYTLRYIKSTLWTDFAGWPSLMSFTEVHTFGRGSGICPVCIQAV